MATTKTFKVAGTTRLPSGTVKVRFANDFVSRIKVLAKNGHTDIELIELGDEMSKADICQMLISHPKFQSEEQQGAIRRKKCLNSKNIYNHSTFGSTFDKSIYYFACFIGLIYSIPSFNCSSFSMR